MAWKIYMFTQVHTVLLFKDSWPLFQNFVLSYCDYILNIFYSNNGVTTSLSLKNDITFEFQIIQMISYSQKFYVFLKTGIYQVFIQSHLCTLSLWIYFAVVVLNVKDEEKEAQYSIYIPVVGSAPYLETGQKTQPVLTFIVKF